MFKNLLEELKWQLAHEYESMQIIRQINALFEIIERYLIIADLDNGTIHSKIFRELYLAPKSKSYLDIASDNNIHERTLNRYVTKYNDLAKKIIINKFPELKERYSSFLNN